MENIQVYDAELYPLNSVNPDDITPDYKGFSNQSTDRFNSEEQNQIKSDLGNSNGEKLKHSYMPNAGLIFVRSEDALSMVAISITKQPYSNIGFFYVTNATGIKRINVMLVDVYRFTTPTWFSNGTTLQDLIDNPLVSGIALKGLRPITDENGNVDEEKTSELNCKFRAAIGMITSNGVETSNEEIISQLFGYEVKNPTKGVTAVEMVNRVIQKIGMWDKIPQDGSLSAEALRLLEVPHSLSTDSNSKVQMIKILTSHFNQQEIHKPNVANKLMQSYIVTNDLFNNMQKISLPERDPNMVRQAQEASATLNTGYMASIVSTFIKMIINDQEFFKTVVNGFNQTRLAELNDKESLKRSILKLSDDSDALSKFITEWIHTGETPYESLLFHLHKMNESKDSIQNQHRLTLGNNSSIPTVNRSKLLLLHKNGKSNSNDPAYLVGAYMCLRENVSQLTNSVTRNEDRPTIDINDIIHIVNDIGSSLGLDIDNLPTVHGYYSAPCIIKVTDERNHKVPISLRSGKKIYITLVKPDLDGLDRATLIEILEALDTMTSRENDRYNELRSEITSKLAHM